MTEVPCVHFPRETVENDLMPQEQAGKTSYAEPESRPQTRIVSRHDDCQYGVLPAKSHAAVVPVMETVSFTKQSQSRCPGL